MDADREERMARLRAAWEGQPAAARADTPDGAAPRTHDDYSFPGPDGTRVDPLSPADGRARVLITEVIAADGTVSYALDYWNCRDADAMSVLYARGLNTVLDEVQRKGNPDDATRTHLALRRPDGAGADRHRDDRGAANAPAARADSLSAGDAAAATGAPQRPRA